MPAKQQFKVGTRVSLLFGTRRVVGEVVEDRGPIGVGGRRLLSVQLSKTNHWSEPIVLEVPESDLKFLKAPPSSPTARRSAAARSTATRSTGSHRRRTRRAAA